MERGGFNITKSQKGKVWRSGEVANSHSGEVANSHNFKLCPIITEAVLKIPRYILEQPQDENGEGSF